MTTARHHFSFLGFALVGLLVVLGGAWAGYTSARADTPAAAVQVEPFAPPAEVDAPSSAPAAEQPAPTATVPDPVEQPAEAAGLLYRLYKAGHLVPAIIVALFLVLTLLQRWVTWLRTGWRRLVVTAILGGSLMLVERAAEGTTPNLLMVMGAIGSILTLYMRGQGESKQEAA